MHPDDRDKNSVTDDLAAGTEPRFQVEFRIVRPNGEIRWCYGAGIISRDADGKRAAHERRHGRRHRPQAHRGAAAAARPRGRPSRQEHAGGRAVGAAAHARQDHAEFIRTVEGRIQALAATHNLLSATRWQGANLRQIVDEELAPYRADQRDRVVADGPPAMLLPATAQAMALALHELATNAAKYGALSTEAGRLRLHWSIGKDALELEWTETGGPTDRAAVVARLRPHDRALQHRGAVPRRRDL